MIRRAIVGAVILAVGIGTGAHLAPAPVDPARIIGEYATGGDGIIVVRADGSARFEPISEDHPSWDCSIMGNRRCGNG